MAPQPSRQDHVGRQPNGGARPANATAPLPRVSVCIVTFMQKETIGQCLDSVLAQRTTFPYEVIVGDDCSTDGTAEICAEYEQRHEGRITAILHATRAGMMENTRSVSSRARGEFIAWCDGDDFWTDPHKLELQVAALTAHPGCDLCSHRAEIVEQDGSPTGRAFPQFGDRIIAADELLRRDGGLISTSSLMSRTSLMRQAPEWFFRMPVGDYFGQAIGAFRGGAVHLGRSMCAYRRDSMGTHLIAGRSARDQMRFYCLMIEGLLGLDSMSQGAHRRRIAIEVLRRTRKGLRRTALRGSASAGARVAAAGCSALAELLWRSFRAWRMR
jgi:glycosyltransferase involved in cell wall biosynthesis